MGESTQSSETGDAEMMQARKLTFQEAWDSSTVFFVDEELESEIDDRVAGLLDTSQNPHIADGKEKTTENIVAFLGEVSNALNVILRDIGLSDEKFMRIISLLRKIDRISGGNHALPLLLPSYCSTESGMRSYPCIFRVIIWTD